MEGSLAGLFTFLFIFSPVLFVIFLMTRKGIDKDNNKKTGAYGKTCAMTGQKIISQYTYQLISGEYVLQDVCDEILEYINTGHEQEIKAEKLDLEQLKELKERKKKLLNNEINHGIIFADMERGLFRFKKDERLKGFAGYKQYEFLRIEDIISIDVIENGNTVASGGLGNAIVGGMLFGSIGALVGAVAGNRKNNEICTYLAIKITINDLNNPVETITFIDGSEVDKTSSTYRNSISNLQKYISFFNVLLEREKKKKDKKTLAVVNENFEEKHNKKDLGNSLENIKKLKELLDMGAITQEEFDMKKKELLGL